MSGMIRTILFIKILITMFIVTGGSRGIGRSLAYALADRGQTVLVLGRHEDSLAKTAQFSPNIQFRRVDVASPIDRQALIEDLKAGPMIQGLVHNAGVVDPIIPISELSESAWRSCMATNVEAPLFLTQQLTEKLRDGRVLHIGSGAAYFPIFGWGAYCVSKAALSMLTRCWQLESKSTAFASVMPGIIDTEMQRQIRETQHMDPDKQDFFRRLKKNNRLLSTDTVALFLCWLLLDIDATKFMSQEWDIYDKSHHASWLRPPHLVPEFEE